MNGIKNKLSQNACRRMDVQFFRGIAIFAVILIHCGPLGYTGVWIRPFINFAVALFVFISGYMTDLGNWSVKKGIKRIVRVIVPYIIWSFFYMLFFGQCDVKTIVYNLFTGNAMYQLYFIVAYIQLTLLIPVLKKYLDTYWLGICAFLIAVIWMVVYKYQIHFIIPYHFVRFPCWLFYFWLGLCIRNKPEGIFKFPPLVQMGGGNCRSERRKFILA